MSGWISKNLSGLAHQVSSFTKEVIITEGGGMDTSMLGMTEKRKLVPEAIIYALILQKHT